MGLASRASGRCGIGRLLLRGRRRGQGSVQERAVSLAVVVEEGEGKVEDAP